MFSPRLVIVIDVFGIHLDHAFVYLGKKLIFFIIINFLKIMLGSHVLMCISCQKTKSGMGSPDWNVSMVDIHPQKLLSGCTALDMPE